MWGISSTYNCCNNVKFPISGGKVPWKLFELKLLHYKKKMAKSYMDTASIQESSNQSKIKGGITHKERSLVRFPSSLGTTPVKLFIPSALHWIKICNIFKFLKKLGKLIASSREIIDWWFDILTSIPFSRAARFLVGWIHSTHSDSSSFTTYVYIIKYTKWTD